MKEEPDVSKAQLRKYHLAIIRMKRLLIEYASRASVAKYRANLFARAVVELSRKDRNPFVCFDCNSNWMLIPHRKDCVVNKALRVTGKT